ncbi:spore germination protein [Clostridium sp. SYSU_GA19001]|uniref:spore germination protein n=1 Tax=Clostridium caldaquaticum TaxID=2940653 RepID=UPI002076FFF0|nr:spore germination protein [Clostridium caldaquaticum]MCM8709510.1 spore germination protein [Clostridium caldaquaticum]
MKLFNVLFGGNSTQSNTAENNTLNKQSIPLNTNLKDSMQYILNTLGNSYDVSVRIFVVGKNIKIKMGVIYVEGLVDKAVIQHFILESLMLETKKTSIEQQITSPQNLAQIVRDIIMPAAGMKFVKDYEQLFDYLLYGYTIVFIDGWGQAIAVNSKGAKSRSIEEPTSQTVIRGPKEGFTENLGTNTALIRRKIKNPNLWIESKFIGRQTKTEVAVAYIKGIADDKVVKEVHSRLNKINIDSILESGYIEELIHDEPYSPFPTVFNTERPDTIASGLLEGRIAIFVDGTPFVLLVPALFVQFFHVSEDYYNQFIIGSMTRVLRYFSFFLALLVPSLYVAVTTFHQEMIPATLLINIAAQREGVPLPVALEALIMEITFEILREAGVRMPRAVGPAISIVGALVLGESAVKAGVVSPITVIIVSITAICSFIFPAFNMAISVRILRFIFLLLSATFGLYGIALGLIVMVLHLCSLRSFGVPYLSPMSPFVIQDQKDSILHFPIHKLWSRPKFISKNNIIRQKDSGPKKPE